MKILVLACAALWMAAACCLAEREEPPFRVWKSRQGSEMTAKVMRLFMAGETPMVELRTEAGRDLKLRIDQLSDADETHIYDEYGGEFGKVRAMRTVEPAPDPAAEDGGFTIKVRREGGLTFFAGLDVEYLFAPPAGARLSRATIPVTGDRDGGDAWLQRILVGHAAWWAQAGMLESRYQFNSERLDKQMWREFGGKLSKGSGGELHTLAHSMNALLAKREGEVAGVSIQYLTQVTPELLCAAATGPAMVAVNLTVLKGGRKQWEAPVAVFEAWDDGKVRIGLWNEMMELKMEALPQDQWIPVRAPKGLPQRIPVYTLRVDPADSSQNASHLRDNEYELRVGPQQGGAAVLVYSPNFTPKRPE